MSNNSKGRPFTHAGIIINKNLNNHVRYRFLMKRKDSTSDEKFMSDVTLSQELMTSILTDRCLINERCCYMEYKTHGTRFEFISSIYMWESYGCGVNWYYEQLITMRDNKTGIEYEFDTRDRFQEVGPNNIPKASQYVKTIRYEDLNFKASLIKANYPTGKEQPVEKELSVMDVIAALTDTERKSIVDRLTKRCKELTESIGLNELMAKFHGGK